MLSKYVRILLLEFAWLLCGWAFSFVVTGFLVGYRLLWQGFDIQLHNTYFVLTTGSAMLPLFLLFATVITCFRALHDDFRLVATKVVLGALAAGWLLLFFLCWVVVRIYFH